MRIFFMHKSLCLLTAITATFLMTAPADAAKKDRANRGDRASANMLGRFDRDNNGSLDDKEAGRVRQLFSALKKLDADNSGDLSESELKAAKVAEPRKKRAAKKSDGVKKKRKKRDA
jgi:hypothetical protein